MNISRSLKDEFCKYFDLYVATTEQLKSYVYQVRYNVYCKEFKFERAEDFPDGEEKDSYDKDKKSVHCLIMHKSHNRPAGCIRIIPATCGGETMQMPIEKVCPGIMNHDSLKQEQFPRSMMCEASRLAVDGVFRRRAGEFSSRVGEQSSMDIDTVEIGYRSFNLVSESIFLAGLATAEILETPIAFAMMEPFLPRVCRRAGINFQKLGDEVDYHGLRAPYFTDTRNIGDSLAPGLMDLYEHIRQEMKESYSYLKD